MDLTKMNLYFSTKSNKKSKKEKQLNTLHKGNQINKKEMPFAHLKGFLYRKTRLSTLVKK